jgi:spore germination cell wall hydrolase CwlJ-like protein
MRLHLCRTIVAMAAIALSGAAFADVTVSQSNDPTVLIGEQFASLFGAEHAAVNAIPEEKRDALANSVAQPAQNPGQNSGQLPAVVKYSSTWLASLPAPQGDQQWDCLRKALYFEARGESLKGQFAVAEVVLNRVDSPEYPKSICGVVQSRGSGSCAFSWVCDGNSDVMRDPVARDIAGQIARVMLDGAPRTLTLGATYFHSRQVSPNWGNVIQTTAIGAHVFYRSPTSRLP